MKSSLPHCSNLAKYVFGQGIEVQFGLQLEPIQKHLLSMHESYHYHMCSSTPFGLFQRFLGLLSKSSYIPELQKRTIETALSTTVDQSWNSHEGVATICEIAAYMLARGTDSIDKYLNAIPDEYLAAIKHFEFINGLKDIPLVVLMPVFEAIGYAALATNILEDMSEYEKFIQTDWENYLIKDDKCPDIRFKIIGKTLLQPKYQNQLSDLIKERISIESGFFNQEDFVHYYLQQPLWLQISLQETVKEDTISWLRNSFSFRIDDDSQTNLLTKHDLMVDSWFKSFRSMDINVVRESRMPIKTFDDRYRAFLSQLHYVPEKTSESSDFEEIDEAKVEDILASFNIHDIHLYMKFSNQVQNKEVLNATVLPKIESDSTLVYLHIYQREAEQDVKSFHCVKSVDGSDRSHFVFSLNVNSLQGLGKRLVNYKRTFVCEEIFYSRFDKELLNDSVWPLLSKPLIIIPEGSSLEHWSKTITELDNSRPLVMYHDFWNEKFRAERDFCLLTNGQGNLAWARPSSVWISNWLLEKNPQIKKCANLDQLAEKFSADWVSNVGSFFYHFAKFGF